MPKFIHVGFAFPGVPKMRDLEGAMTQASIDWVRYSRSNWLLWTDRTPAGVIAVISTHIDTNDQVLAVELDINTRFGRLTPWIWQWIDSKGVTSPTVTVDQNELLRLLGSKNS